MSNYHSRPEVSATMLKSMAKGWRTFEAEHITREAERKESQAFVIGSAVHAALLERDAFAERYAICPQECSDRRTKAYKEWAAEVTDREILTQADAALIAAIENKCFDNQSVRQLLEAPGGVEIEFFWRCKTTDVDCRAKADKVLAGGVVLDVKTTDDARPEAFARTVGMYRYDLQAVHYMDATGATTFIFLAVEKTAPFRVRLYELCNADLADAREMRASLLREYLDRKIRNDWSEPNELSVQTLFLPNYLKG